MKIIITGEGNIFYWRLYDIKGDKGPGVSIAFAVSPRSYTRRASARRAARVFLSKMLATSWIDVEA